MKKSHLVFLILIFGIGLGLGNFLKHIPFSAERSFNEDFSRPLKVRDGAKFGKGGKLTFELYRGGTFLIDGQSGHALQRSAHYGDVAIIRSTRPLPKTYKISVVVGQIDYELERVQSLSNDPNYTEGPRDENGVYLIAITDQAPAGHYTNDWWHQHRKVVMDVDNNVWGNGMPHPVFMVYFDQNNQLVSWDAQERRWQSEWRKAVTYDPYRWYRLELEKTGSEYIFTIADEAGNLLAQERVALERVWHSESHPDYFVIGEPHENYYQGEFKIQSITIS